MTTPSAHVFRETYNKESFSNFYNTELCSEQYFTNVYNFLLLLPLTKKRNGSKSKQTCVQFLKVKKFPALSGNLKFIAVYTTARYLSLSWPTISQSVLFKAHCNVVIPSKSWSVGAGFFLQDFQRNSCIHLSSRTRVPHAPLLLYYRIFRQIKRT